MKKFGIIALIMLSTFLIGHFWHIHTNHWIAWVLPLSVQAVLIYIVAKK